MTDYVNCACRQRIAAEWVLVPAPASTVLSFTCKPATSRALRINLYEEVNVARNEAALTTSSLRRSALNIEKSATLGAYYCSPYKVNDFRFIAANTYRAHRPLANAFAAVAATFFQSNIIVSSRA